MRVGITETFNEDIYQNYNTWIQSMDSSVETVPLSYKNTNSQILQSLSGLVLTGGGDVDPRYYHQDDRVQYARGVNEQRDAFEFEIIDHALDINLPILGVCRGIQVMNVYLGGSLILDLVASRFDDHQGDDLTPRYHPISIVRSDSILYSLAQKNDVLVNSFHHQAVDRLGRGLMITAQSHDGVVEAAEWALKDSMPFLLLVQWHPERIPNDDLSQSMLRKFLEECYKYKQ
ncbi:MAG: gamma-glutamyl-gamma-aminobutyrate hydrolase family protein [Bacteroidetes bacterium]|nr:gamma-glutamyl-gamma-aminobutyrate hydrolase family protein [Bacteroidota bacterium]